MTLTEMRFLRREIIADCLQQSYGNFDEIAAFVRDDERERYGHELNIFVDWDQYEGAPMPDEFSDVDGAEFPVYYDAQGREHAEF